MYYASKKLSIKAASPLRREPSAAGHGGKRRNSHQSAVFGEAGNGTAAGNSKYSPHLPSHPGHESSEANRGRKRRNSHHSAAFGKAGNGAVVGISELVEVGGVEPPSESTLTGCSPGADDYCGSLPSCSPSRRQTVTPSGQVSFMMCGTGKAYRTHIYR